MAQAPPSHDIRVTLATLESHPHEVNAIRSGIKLFEAGAVEEAGQFGSDDDVLIVPVRDRGELFPAVVAFRRGGADLSRHGCVCGIGGRGDTLCKHIVAAVLGVQGGLPESAVVLGLAGAATTVVDATNTARAVRSGDVDVFATPMLVALMEEAACAALRGKLEPGRTSVGTAITVSHKAASPLGATVTATATLERVFGHRLEFAVAARDESRRIADGRHTRVLVDQAEFASRAERRGRPR
ncbi:MAG: hypothetical protein LBS56_09185 [Propionibacteriaceae bacterium]|jgi:predicted thioesterase|nr:hypothetical protein [Propionibacteriaceae bacterium]